MALAGSLSVPKNARKQQKMQARPAMASRMALVHKVQNVFRGSKMASVFQTAHIRNAMQTPIVQKTNIVVYCQSTASGGHGVHLPGVMVAWVRPVTKTLTRVIYCHAKVGYVWKNYAPGFALLTRIVFHLGLAAKTDCVLMAANVSKIKIAALFSANRSVCLITRLSSSANVNPVRPTAIVL